MNKSNPHDYVRPGAVMIDICQSSMLLRWCCMHDDIDPKRGVADAHQLEHV